MNDSILQIIKYILKKKNVINEDESIGSFFSNGISFPIFIAKILNFVSIPGLKLKVASKEDCEYNNNKAFQFLLEYCENVKLRNPSFKTNEDKIQLLKLILTIQCFPEKISLIMKRLNLVFEPLKIKINNEKDLLDFKNVSALLNIFTNGLFPITNSFKEIFNYCSKTEIPLVINESAIENQYLYIFVIQIQIFFDYFSGLNQQTLDSIKEQIQKKNPISKPDCKSKDQSPQLEKQINEQKNNSAINSLQTKEKNTNDRRALELWNHSLNNHVSFNGILVLKSPREVHKDNDNDNDKKICEDNLYKIFQYDETQYKWRFNESEFDKLLGSSSQDPLIPLVLYINTDYSDVLNSLSKFKEDIKEYNFGEDISVLLLRQEIPENTQEKKFFLFVHIPIEKMGNIHMRSIYYQIYTFLYLICDVSVFSYSNFHNNILFQTHFLNNMLKISDIYLKHAKESTGQNIFNDNSQLFCFIEPDLEIQDYQKYIKERVKRKISNIYKDKYIDDIDLVLNLIKFNNSYRFSELKEIFRYSSTKFSEISELYLFITLDLRNEDHPYFIRSIINTVYDYLFSDQKYRNSKGSIIDDIKKESGPFYPKYDINFSNIFEKELLEKASETDQFEKIILIDELKKYSKKNLDCFNQKIKERGYCNKDQTEAFKRGHHLHLQQYFFEIIKKVYKGSINLVYEQFVSILQSQISEDNEKLDDFYEKYVSQNMCKSSEKFDEASKKSTNYVVKEIETTREIEINIHSEDDLDKIIPQDF